MLTIIVSFLVFGSTTIIHIFTRVNEAVGGALHSCVLLQASTLCLSVEQPVLNKKGWGPSLPDVTRIV